jgi:hypothetical protein
LKYSPPFERNISPPYQRERREAAEALPCKGRHAQGGARRRETDDSDLVVHERLLPPRAKIVPAVRRACVAAHLGGSLLINGSSHTGVLAYGKPWGNQLLANIGTRGIEWKRNGRIG